MENQKIGSFIGRLNGQDLDSGLNGLLRFRLLDNMDNFYVDERFGIVYIFIFNSFLKNLFQLMLRKQNQC